MCKNTIIIAAATVKSSKNGDKIPEFRQLLSNRARVSHCIIWPATAVDAWWLRLQLSLATYPDNMFPASLLILAVFSAAISNVQAAEDRILPPLPVYNIPSKGFRSI